MQLFERLARYEVNPATECWEWTGYCSKRGYGKVSYKGAPRLAHRVMYELIYGPTPLYVLHRCDNPPCINPEHLFAGTQRDNMRDSVRKGRHYDMRGERSWRAKLTEKQVLEIRCLQGRYRDIAQQFGVGIEQIYRIKNNKTWRHI